MRKRRKKGKTKKKPPSNCVVVMIVQGHAVPFEKGANSDASEAPDQVCWANSDSADYRIKFIDGWPFTGTDFEIPVAALSVSAWQKVKNGAGTKRKYLYRVINGAEPPPDGPSIVTDQ